MNERFLAAFAALGTVACALACPVLPGDLDGDGDVDGADFGVLEECVDGPGDPLDGACTAADLDGDGDADLADVAVLQAGATASACGPLGTVYAGVSYDGGASFLPYGVPPPSQYFLTYGLAEGEPAGLYFMHAADAVWVSKDNACSWTNLAATGPGLYHVATGPDGAGYIWPVNGQGTAIYSVARDPNAPSGLAVTDQRLPEPELLGLAVDAADGNHVRAVGKYGQIHESFDAGASWGSSGGPAAGGTLVIGYFGAFDPQNLDHAIYGRSVEGGYVTFNAGKTWTKSVGLSASGTGNVNLFNGVISSVDGQVVHVMGLDLEESDHGAPSGGRHIYRSTDGGLTYAPVLDHQKDGVLLQNGPVMLADGRAADVLHFVFSARPLFGGTTFYTYDGAGPSLTLVQNTEIPQVRALARSKLHPCQLVVGYEFLP